MGGPGDRPGDRLWANGYSLSGCREGLDYATEYKVPIRLFAAVGSAGNGTCWYWSSACPGWEIITRNSDGSAFMGYDSDGVRGGP